MHNATALYNLRVNNIQYLIVVFLVTRVHLFINLINIILIILRNKTLIAMI